MTQAKPHNEHEASPLGILAGGGELPRQLIDACKERNRSCFLLGFEGTTNLNLYPDVQHASVRLGAIGEALEHLRASGVTDIVMAGSIKRPPLSSIKPDKTGAKLLARLGGAMFAGDDALLSQLIQFMEEEGFRVLGASDILGSLLAPAGTLGKIAPDTQELQDIRKGMNAARQLGRMDIGQAAVIENGIILGLEGAEGTDALIARCGWLKKEPGRSAVLVKAKKPQQEMRADLPAIGPQTVERAHAAGFAGIAVEAGGALLIDSITLIRRADHYGMFVYGAENL